MQMIMQLSRTEKDGLRTARAEADRLSCRVRSSMSRQTDRLPGTEPVSLDSPCQPIQGDTHATC